jgi:hypothetical protein
MFTGPWAVGTGWVDFLSLYVYGVDVDRAVVVVEQDTTVGGGGGCRLPSRARRGVNTWDELHLVVWEVHLLGSLIVETFLASSEVGGLFLCCDGFWVPVLPVAGEGAEVFSVNGAACTQWNRVHSRRST